jgi:hypothetical protein
MIKLHPIIRKLRGPDQRTSNMSSLPPHLSFPDYRLFLRLMTLVSIPHAVLGVQPRGCYPLTLTQHHIPICLLGP